MKRVLELCSDFIRIYLKIGVTPQNVIVTQNVITLDAKCNNVGNAKCNNF